MAKSYTQGWHFWLNPMCFLEEGGMAGQLWHSYSLTHSVTIDKSAMPLRNTGMWYNLIWKMYFLCHYKFTFERMTSRAPEKKKRDVSVGGQLGG